MPRRADLYETEILPLGSLRHGERCEKSRRHEAGKAPIQAGATEREEAVNKPVVVRTVGRGGQSPGWLLLEDDSKS